MSVLFFYYRIKHLYYRNIISKWEKLGVELRAKVMIQNLQLWPGLGWCFRGHGTRRNWGKVWEAENRVCWEKGHGKKRIPKDHNLSRVGGVSLRDNGRIQAGYTAALSLWVHSGQPGMQQSFPSTFIFCVSFKARELGDSQMEQISPSCCQGYWAVWDVRLQVGLQGTLGEQLPFYLQGALDRGVLKTSVSFFFLPHLTSLGKWKYAMKRKGRSEENGGALSRPWYHK